MGRLPLAREPPRRQSRAVDLVDHSSWGLEMGRAARRRSFPAVTAATFLTVGALVALAGAPAAASSAAPDDRPGRAAPTALPTRAAAALPTLVDVRAYHRPGVDRVVFELRGGLPARRTATYASTAAANTTAPPATAARSSAAP